MGLIVRVPPAAEHFPNPPITEALLDIRATLAKTTDLDRLGTVQEAIGEDYPSRRERTAFEGSIRIEGGGVGLEGSSRPDGHVFVSRDGRQLVQARLDGFTFNRLRPYLTWEAFRDEARRQWDGYRVIAKPERLTRLAVRYINCLPLPLTLKDFKEYVLITPEIAPGLPQGLAAFFMRLVIPFEAYDCTAIVTETIQAPKDESLPYIFDIDAFVEVDLDPDSSELWPRFERLHEAKNVVFFNTITPKAMELFK